VKLVLITEPNNAGYCVADMFDFRGTRVSNTKRFHFQVRTGTHVMITEFADLGGTREARVEAAKRIGVLLTAHADKLWVDEDWQMDVTDDAGLILFVINVTAMESSATSRSHDKSDHAK
jgi:hypothetical protein